MWLSFRRGLTLLINKINFLVENKSVKINFDYLLNI